MAFGGPPFAVAACILLARVEVSTARRVVRGGESAGGPAPEGYGKLDETTFITVMAFVGLGVVFCALAALSRRGASRLARLDAQLAAARGVRDVEAGDFGGASSRSDPCAVGDVVSLIRRGVRVQGTGVVTRADARRDSYRVRWSRELSDTFTYRPVAGGPLLRARRRPGPKRGWRREDLLLETPPAAAGVGAGAGAPPPSDPIPSARALEGLWLGTWHQGAFKPSRESLSRSQKQSEDMRDGVSYRYDFELALALADDETKTKEENKTVARLRSLPGVSSARASATVHLHTRRLAMELFDTADTETDESSPSPRAAKAFLDGFVTVADEGATVAVDGGWIGADGTFGAFSLRRVGSASVLEASSGKTTTSKGGAEPSSMTDSLTYAPSEGEEGDAERLHEKEKMSSTRGLLRTPSGARARFRALARAAKTHGIAATLLAGIPRANLESSVLDDDDEVLVEETNETNETNDERVS
jgi:hypothetical protein